MVIQFTVVVRTYNGATRLPAILERLQQQVRTEEIAWEVLVVDNNSQDETALVIADHADRWRSNSQIRYVFEPKQGAAYARDCGIAQAAAELVGFLDDDNLPEEDWVAEAFRFGSEHPEIGAYGGNIFPLLDETPPPYFEKIRYLLAVSDRGNAAYQYPRSFPRDVPLGPGLVVRKQAWQECVPSQRRLRGRNINHKFAVGSAEDIEATSYIHTSHWQVWHNPALKVWHHIPARRWEPKYLLKIAVGSGLGHYPCFVGKLQPWLRPFARPLSMGLVVMRSYQLVMYYLINRDTIKTDMATACHFNAQIGKILSPFLTPRPIAYSQVAESPIFQTCTSLAEEHIVEL